MTTEYVPLTPELDAYAEKLRATGEFTIYRQVRQPYDTDARWAMKVRRGTTYFHYSRMVDGMECVGYVAHSEHPLTRGTLEHSMPLIPSRLNGSSAIVGGQWGDEATRGLDALAPDSVEMARVIARPRNWCPVNAEPTQEATARANGGQSMPQKYYRGAHLRNGGPSSIGSLYAREEAAGMSWSEVAERDAAGMCPSSPDYSEPHVVTDGKNCDECGAEVTA